jgi:hypothetical protein
MIGRGGGCATVPFGAGPEPRTPLGHLDSLKFGSGGKMAAVAAGMSKMASVAADVIP